MEEDIEKLTKVELITRYKDLQEEYEELQTQYADLDDCYEEAEESCEKVQSELRNLKEDYTELQEEYRDVQILSETFIKDLRFSDFIQKEIFKIILEAVEKSGIRFTQLDVEVGYEEIEYPEQISLKIADTIEKYI